MIIKTVVPNLGCCTLLVVWHDGSVKVFLYYKVANRQNNNFDVDKFIKRHLEILCGTCIAFILVDNVPIFWLLCLNMVLFSTGAMCTSEMFWRDYQHWLFGVPGAWTSVVQISVLVLPAGVQLLLLWRESHWLLWSCDYKNGM